MYFPYLRGKQYELLAIKNFLDQAPGASHIAPIIEPVRDPSYNGTFSRSVQALSAAGTDHTIVVNPSVGALQGGDREAVQLIVDSLEKLGEPAENLHLALIVGTSATDQALEVIERSAFAGRPVDLIFKDALPPPQVIMKLVSSVKIGRCFASDKDVVRTYREALGSKSVVRLNDRFPKRETNIKYVGQPESLFTTDHRYFDDDGYLGFADYATIGEAFSEGGSSPKAVVIHFTYQDPGTSDVMLMHFSSRTNHDTSDTAGKFSEALDELVAFVESRELSNPAIDEFRSYAVTQRFPGLGMIKKLSLLNHLFLIEAIL